MQIAPEVLAAKNYEGTRLIEVSDPTVLKLRAEIAKFTPEAEPHLKEMEKLSVILDPFYAQIGELQQKLNKIKEEMAPTKALFDVELSALEKIEQKAQLIKDKVQPIVMKLVGDQLGEFEKAKQLIDKDGKLYVEVEDVIEEAVKAHRAQNTK